MAAVRHSRDFISARKAGADNSRLFTISASREFYGVRMIKLTAAREITPYKWVHPLGGEGPAGRSD